MSDIKWIKLSVNMFDDEKIKIIKTLPEGDKILVTWIQLLCLAGKTNDAGLVYMGQNINYTDEMLATIFDEKVNVIRISLQTLEQFEMIEIRDDRTISITNWEKHQSTDKMSRIKQQNTIRQQRHYQRTKLRRLGVDVDAVELPSDIDELKELVERLEKNPNVRLTLANDTEVRSKKEEVRGKKEEVRKNTSRKLKFDDVHFELAELLFSKVNENFPGTEANLESWANDIRLMMERDGRTEKAIRGVINWSQSHEFWYANIRSADKLRKQYDEMFAQADRENKQKKPKVRKKENLPDWAKEDHESEKQITQEEQEELQKVHEENMKEHRERLAELKRLREERESEAT